MFAYDYIRSGSGGRSLVPQHAIMFLSYKIINIKLASFLNGKITMSIYYMHFATHHPITKFVSNTLSCWSCSSTCALASPVISPFPFLRLLLASHTTHIYTSVTGQWLWMLSSTKYFLVQWRLPWLVPDVHLLQNPLLKSLTTTTSHMWENIL